MKRLTFYFCFFWIFLFGQTAEKDALATNAKIDAAVVSKDIGSLSALYADDFVFTHGTGFVEGKASWLRNVQKPETKFISRIQDSTTVELHGNTAILFGRLIIVRQDSDKTVKYGLWYVRVFEKRKKQWQLISHRTTKEWHY